jgi:iron complex transport system substrate-binding protein
VTRSAFLLVVLCVACRSHSAGPDPHHAKSRVVSLSPSTTETVAAIGALSTLVGRSRYCDYPPEVTKLPEVGGYVDPNVEAIVALKPDLVVGARGPAGRRIDDTLRSRAIDTYFPPTESIADIFVMVRGVGARLLRSAEAERLVGRIEARLAEVAERAKSLDHPRVLLLFGVQPIITAGPNSFGDEMLSRAGARNAVTTGDTYPALDVEAVVALDPDFIINAAGAEEHGGQRITKVAAGWNRMRAVLGDHVISLADDVVLRPGPRVAEGIAMLADALHPGVTF